jgi:type IV pilus assembly protein PilA
MFKTLRQRRSSEERGFTLIELMVVVLIIAILIAIAIPTFLGARKRAQDRGAQSNLRNALTAAKTYYTDAETFVGLNAAKGEELEPSLTWADIAAAPPAGTVGIVTLLTSATAVHMVTLSSSGTFFCILETSGSGTTFGRGAAYADVDAAADCAASTW